MQPQIQVQQAPVMVQQTAPVEDTASGIKKNYPHKQALYLSIIQVIIGGLCVLFQIVAIIVGATSASVGTGIWCGILFIFTGVIGIVSSKLRTMGWITGFMVLSIFAAIMTLVLLIAAAVGAGTDNVVYPYRYYSYDGYYNDHKSDKRSARVGMNAILICLALAEAVVSIWSSAICCAGVCCGATGTTGTVMYYNSAVAAPTGQVMVIHQGQPMYTTPVQTTYVQGTPTMVSYPAQAQGGVTYPVAGPAAPPPYAAPPQGQYPAPQPGVMNAPPQQGHPQKM